MSVYGVANLCRDCLIDLDVRHLAVTDPAAAIAIYDITDSERDMLLHGEVGQLYEAGHVEFLLSYLPRWTVFGLDVVTYSARMREAQIRDR